MLDVGRLCIKTAGREAGQKCVVVDAIDENFVTVDGNVRRKRCNILHLEPLKETLEIKKGASREDVIEEFRKAGILAETKKIIRKEKTEKAAKEEPAAKPKDKKPAKKEAKPKK